MSESVCRMGDGNRYCRGLNVPQAVEWVMVTDNVGVYL